MSKTKKILCALCSIIPCSALAKSGSVNYSWGADALATMHDYVVTMMFYVQALCCAIAGICVIVSGFQIYVKMNTGEDGITKSVVTLVGACLFLIGAFLAFATGTSWGTFGILIPIVVNVFSGTIKYRHNDSKELQYLP